MKFPDIDLNSVLDTLNNMSEEEKQDMMNMAQNMMNGMDMPEQPVEEPEEEEDFYSLLGIDQQEYASLPDSIMDALEAAVDMEEFYDQDPQADYSASVLFYAKAVLSLLRQIQAPLFVEVLKKEEFANPKTTTLPMYLAVYMDDDNLHALSDQSQVSLEDWVTMRQLLQSIVTSLSKAEYDTIDFEHLQHLKQQLFQEKGLLLMGSVN